MPRRLEQWIYPINKTDLDVLRFAHFLALAAITVRFVPKGWPGLKSPWLWPLILCGQHSLEIFCLGVFLAFAGYFVLTEIMRGIASAFPRRLHRNPDHDWPVAWLNSWYKRSDIASRVGQGSTAATLILSAVAGRNVAAAQPRRRRNRPDQRPSVLDISDGDAKPFDGADDLAVEIAVAIHMGRRDEELGLVPLLLEVPAQLRERDGLLEREALAANRDRIDRAPAAHRRARCGADRLRAD